MVAHKSNTLPVLILIVLISGLGPCFAQEARSGTVSWVDAINRVQNSAREYYKHGKMLDPDDSIGSGVSGLSYDQHLCAIAGRMLGFEQEIRHLEKFEYPPLTPHASSTDILGFSDFLDTWVMVAQRLVEADEAERINIWNLECVGRQGIPKELALVSGRPEAEFKRDGRRLTVYGDIEPGFFERFKVALDANKGVDEIVLGSGGGSVRDALAAGIEIRRRGLSTTLWGNCYSACPLVFAGGVRRALYATTSRLGFHQLYTDAGPLPSNSPVYDFIGIYLEEMGVDPYTIIRWMLSATPSEMYEPEPDILCAPGMATWVQRRCGF